MYKDGWKAVTINGSRMSSAIAGTVPFDKGARDLYNLNKDLNEAVDGGRLRVRRRRAVLEEADLTWFAEKGGFLCDPSS